MSTTLPTSSTCTTEAPAIVVVAAAAASTTTTTTTTQTTKLTNWFGRNDDVFYDHPIEKSMYELQQVKHLIENCFERMDKTNAVFDREYAETSQLLNKLWIEQVAIFQAYCRYFNHYVVQIQRIARGFLARKLFRQVFVAQCAMKIQRAYRRMIQKRQLRHERLKRTFHKVTRGLKRVTLIRTGHTHAEFLNQVHRHAIVDSQWRNAVGFPKLEHQASIKVQRRLFARKRLHNAIWRVYLCNSIVRFWRDITLQTVKRREEELRRLRQAKEEEDKRLEQQRLLVEMNNAFAMYGNNLSQVLVAQAAISDDNSTGTGAVASSSVAATSPPSYLNRSGSKRVIRKSSSIRGSVSALSGGGGGGAAGGGGEPSTVTGAGAGAGASAGAGGTKKKKISARDEMRLKHHRLSTQIGVVSDEDHSRKDKVLSRSGSIVRVAERDSSSSPTKPGSTTTGAGTTTMPGSTASVAMSVSIAPTMELTRSQMSKMRLVDSGVTSPSSHMTSPRKLHETRRQERTQGPI